MCRFDSLVLDETGQYQYHVTVQVGCCYMEPIHGITLLRAQQNIVFPMYSVSNLTYYKSIKLRAPFNSEYLFFYFFKFFW